MIELTSRVAAAMAFEIVLGPEQALTTGLALAARDCAQRVEPAGDRGEEALLRLHVRRNGPEQGRLRLVGAVGAAEALDGGICLPAGFKQVVNTQAAIPGRKFGMVRTSSAAGIAEDKDALGVIHEGRGLSEVCRCSTVLNDEPVALADYAARASRDLGNDLRAEALDNLVERARHGRERGELFDQAVTALDGFSALDRVAVAIDRPGAEITLAVGEGLVELYRKGMGEIVEDILAWRDVDLDV